MSFSSSAVGLVHHLGAVGIGAGVFLNGLSVPGLSEVLLPLGGLAVKQGHLNLWVLLPVVIVAQLAGLSCAYALARFGGVALLERYGKYILLSHHDLMAAHKAFEKHGAPLVIVGSFIPGVQGVVGYVAGLAQMPYRRFLVAVFLGKLVWIGGLLYLGSILGSHLDLIDRWIKQIGIVVLAAVVILGIWYVARHKRRQA